MNQAFTNTDDLLDLQVEKNELVDKVCFLFKQVALLLRPMTRPLSHRRTFCPASRRRRKKNSASQASHKFSSSRRRRKNIRLASLATSILQSAGSSALLGKQIIYKGSELNEKFMSDE